MQEKLNELKTRLLEVDDLQMAAALLYWDQATYMPPGGAEARGRQMATLSQLAIVVCRVNLIGQLWSQGCRVWGECSTDSLQLSQFTLGVQRPITFPGGAENLE